MTAALNVVKISKTPKWYLYIITTIVNILSFSAGVGVAWTSSSIPKLNGIENSNQNPLRHPINFNEEAWITSLLTIGVIIGCFLFGYLSEKFGHKKTIIISTVPIAICFILKACATKVAYFYVARLIGGVGFAVIFTVVPIYIGEIADDTNRGTLGCFMPLFITVGICYTYCIGPFLSIMVFNIINVVPPLLCAALTTFLVPNSPYYLIRNNKYAQAETSLCAIRGKLDVNHEITMIMNIVNTSHLSKTTFLDIFKTRESKKGILVSCGLMVFQQFCGISVLLSYMQIIFNSAQTSLSPKVSTIIVGFVQLFACCLSPIFIDRLGRKVLLYFSLLGTCISNALLGLFFYYNDNHYNVDDYTWVPVLSLMFFMLCYNCGIGPVPWAMVGELFSSTIKAKASTITTFVCFLLSFATNFAFPYLKVYVGYPETFWFFACCCVVGFLFVVIVVPETKNKSLQEILAILRK